MNERIRYFNQGIRRFCFLKFLELRPRKVILGLARVIHMCISVCFGAKREGESRNEHGFCLRHSNSPTQQREIQVPFRGRTVSPCSRTPLEPQGTWKKKFELAKMTEKPKGWLCLTSQRRGHPAQRKEKRTIALDSCSTKWVLYHTTTQLSRNKTTVHSWRSSTFRLSAENRDWSHKYPECFHRHRTAVCFSSLLRRSKRQQFECDQMPLNSGWISRERNCSLVYSVVWAGWGVICGCSAYSLRSRARIAGVPSGEWREIILPEDHALLYPFLHLYTSQRIWPQSFPAHVQDFRWK